MSIYVQFKHFPEERVSEQLGPFEAVSVRYGELVSLDPDTIRNIAYVGDDCWMYDDQLWTDVNIYTADEGNE